MYCLCQRKLQYDAFSLHSLGSEYGDEDGRGTIM